MSTLFIDNLRQHLDLFSRLELLDEPIAHAAATITDCLRNGGKLLICGNGGSAADSQHIAAEFTGRFIEDREPIAALALSTDTSALTCIGNDYSFDEVFSRQVRALGRPGDCLLAITTSGNSGNVLAAVHAAQQRGMSTIGLLGRDGGKAAGICTHSIVVPSQVTARIQEAHILIGHTLCGSVERALGMVPCTQECA
jgi:D-sedoheptulose 7-phosphate isomerase